MALLILLPSILLSSSSFPHLHLNPWKRQATPFESCDSEFARRTSTHVPLSGTQSHGQSELRGSLGNIIPSWASIFLAPQYTCVCVCMCCGVILLLQGRRLYWPTEENEQCQCQHKTLFLIVAPLIMCKGQQNLFEPQFYPPENHISQSHYPQQLRREWK